MSENIIETRSFDFAVRVVHLYKHLTKAKREFVMAKQLLRCGTSIGANIAEGEKGQRKADFNAKMNIAMKEANETYYWLRLLHRTGYLNDREFLSMKRFFGKFWQLLRRYVKKQIYNSAFCTLHFAFYRRENNYGIIF